MHPRPKSTQTGNMSQGTVNAMSLEEMGCCGAYCGSCPVIKNGACKGCKLGYSDGLRDLEKARCAIKKCCMQKGFVSCADCAKMPECPTLNEFYSKNGYKYKKYKQAIDYINGHGYEDFLAIANKWKNAYGKYK